MSGFVDSSYYLSSNSIIESLKSKEKMNILQYIKEKSFDDRQYLQSHFDDQSIIIQYSAAEALIHFFYSPINTKSENADRDAADNKNNNYDDDDLLKRKLNLISNFFSSPSKFIQKCGRKALINLLQPKMHEKQASLLKTVFDHCYSGDQNKSMNYFLVIAELYETGKLKKAIPAILLTLALHTLCDHHYIVRQVAVKFLELICKNCFPGNYTFLEYATIFETYHANQQLIASQIASQHPQVSYDLVFEAFIRFRFIDDSARDRLLQFITPFLCNIDLSSLNKSNACLILETLSIITYKYGEQLTTTIEAIWGNLAISKTNIVYIINYLIHFAILRRNDHIFTIAEKITLIISKRRKEFFNILIKKLISDLFSTKRVGRMITIDEYREICDRQIEEQNKMTSSWAKDSYFVFPSILKNKPLSRSNLSIMLIHALIMHNFEAIKSYLPIILCTIIITIDTSNHHHVTSSYHSIIHNLYFHIKHHNHQSSDHHHQQHAIDGDNHDNDFIDNFYFDVKMEKIYRRLLQIIEKGWNKLDFQFHFNPPSSSSLHRRGDDVDHRHSSERTENEEENNEMIEFIHLLIDFVHPLVGDITHDLMMSSLKWATMADSSHLICRSLQLYRSLKQPIDHANLYYLISILTNHLNDRNQSNSNQNIMFEVLLSLKSSVSFSSHHSILKNPQIWSLTMLSLQTDNENEFAYSIDLLSTILKSIDVPDLDVYSHLRSITLNDLDLQIEPIISKGLSSRYSEEISRLLFSSLLNLSSDNENESKKWCLADNIVSQIPIFLHYFHDHQSSNDSSVTDCVLTSMTDNLVSLFERLNIPTLAFVFSKFKKAEYGSEDHFMNELMPPLYHYFIRGNECRALSSLFYQIIFGTKKYKREIIKIVASFFKLVDLNHAPEINQQMMATFYHFIPLIHNRDYYFQTMNDDHHHHHYDGGYHDDTDLSNQIIDLIDVIVQSSKQVDHLNFSDLPNPSVIAKIIEKIDAIANPWPSFDSHKSLVLPYFKQVLTTMDDPNYMNINDFDDEVKNIIPELEKNTVYAYNQPSSFAIIETSSSNNAKKFIKFDRRSFHPPPDYEAPQRPNVVSNALKIGTRSSMKKEQFKLI